MIVHSARNTLGNGCLVQVDDDGRPLADGADTTQGTGARVLCEVVAP